MQIAVVDWLVIGTNPVGSLHRALVEGLAEEHDFVVFSIEFDNPRPDRIDWVRVWAPRRPLFLLFLIFHFTAKLALWRYCRRHKRSFDLVHSVVTNLWRADVIDVHFCDRVYIEKYWRYARPQGLRRLAAWVDHRVRAAIEPHVYKHARALVLPSRGAANEFVNRYPSLKSLARTIHNPVNRARLAVPLGFDRRVFRRTLDLGHDDLTLAFVALGHFERKGLPIVLRALSLLGTDRHRLLVVGGSPDVVGQYRRLARKLLIDDLVTFVGMQTDVRPYLWASDAFVFPSAYEAFPLVALEAAAAELPLIATDLNGVNEILVDGVSGVKVERDARSVADGISRVAQLSPEDRRRMAQQAAERVRRFDPESYLSDWRELYLELSSPT